MSCFCKGRRKVLARRARPSTRKGRRRRPRPRRDLEGDAGCRRILLQTAGRMLLVVVVWRVA